MLARFMLALLLAGFAASSSAAPAFNRDLDALRIAHAVSVEAKRADASPASRTRLGELLQEASDLQARIDGGGVRVGVAAQRSLERAIGRLERAIAHAEAKVAPAAPTGATGTVSGTVFDAGSTPLQSIDVQARNPTTGVVVLSQPSAANGTFSLALPAGTYTIRARGTGTPAPGYVSVVYDGIDCPTLFNQTRYCRDYSGTPIVVAAGGSVTGIDFHLPRAGAIAGTVTRLSDGTPVGGIVNMLALAEDGSFVASAATSTAAGMVGTYRIDGVPPGRYRVFADANGGGSGLSDLVHSLPDKPCAQVEEFEDCSYLPVDYVTVNSGAVTTGIDFALPARLTVTGTVRDVSANPIEGARVLLVSRDGATLALSDTPTDAAGNFAFSELRPTAYTVIATAPGYLDKLYPADVSVANCLEAKERCDPIGVGGTFDLVSNESGFDIVLERGASISGRLTRADGLPFTTPLEVSAASRSLFTFVTTTSDASGNYTISGLPDGVFHVHTGNAGSLTNTAYGDVVCPGDQGVNCIDKGIPVTASVATPVTGIDIAVATAGSVSGVIRDALTGLPLRVGTGRIELFAVPEPGQPQPNSYTYVAGQGSGSGYTLSGVAPGAYRAVFAASGRVGWMDTASNGVPCPRGGCDQSVLPSIVVTADTPITGLDITLERGTIVKGRLTDAATGRGIMPAAFDPTGGQADFPSVFLYTPAGQYAGVGSIDASGGYGTSTGFPPGTYFGSSFSLRQQFSGKTFPFGYLDQNYLNVRCPYGSCGVTAGAGIPVVGDEVLNIDYAFERGGTIAGRIARAGDLAGLSGVTIDAFDAQGRRIGEAFTNRNGGYTLYGMPTGNVYLSTRNELGFLDEAYDNIPCEPFCNAVTSTAVAVTAPNARTGIDFVLAQSAMISGTVSNGAPAGNVAVELYGAIGNFLTATTSAANGAFAFRDLAGGRYYVRTRNALGRVDALFNGATCLGDACQVRSGTPIDVNAGQSAVANLALTAPATISGTVTNQVPSNMSGVQLQLLDARGVVAASTRTAPNGTYQFASLPAGSYRVVTRNVAGFVNEAFDDVPCPATCDGSIGTPIVVATGEAKTANIQLLPGGAISGTVTSSTIPIPGVVVQAWLPFGTTLILAGQQQTNTLGNYQIRSLPTGSYRLLSQNTLGLVNEVFDNRPCSGYCDLVSGSPVDVTAGTTVSGRNFALDFGRSITGQVFSTATGGVIAGVTVQAYASGTPAGTSTTDADGFYSIGGLVPGRYKLRTFATTGAINQVYRAPTPQPCTPAPCLLSNATEINVTTSDVSGINFNLAPGSSISGTATDQFFNPLQSFTATLFGSGAAPVLTGSFTGGRWEFNGVAAGTYYVLIENSDGLIDELYANLPCPSGACTITAGTPIVVGAAARTKGAAPSNATIDLQLGAGLTISGRVRDATTTAPLANATVYFFNSAGGLVGDAVTDGAGNYVSTGGFAPGTYYAATASGEARGVAGGYVNGLWSSGTCLLGCTVTNGTPITITAAPVANIDFNLGTGIGFAGRVVDSNAVPVQQVTIRVVDSAGRAAGTFTTNSLGVFVADGLTAGTYYARTVSDVGLQDVLYGNAPCVGNCTVTTSNPITISAGSQPQNIDFTLGLLAVIFGDGFE